MKQATLFITVFFSFAFLMGIFLPEEGWAQGNDIISFRVVSETSNQIVMEVRYAYAGNFGNNVFIGAKMANNGESSRYFAYGPGRVSRGRRSTRVTLNTSSRAPARLTTNQIQLSMYIGGSYSFLEEFFPYNKTWTSVAVRSSGNIDIPQTYIVDLDNGRLRAPRSDADLWFEADTATLRYITPQNGASIAVLGSAKPDLESCKSAYHTRDRISIRDVSVGTWLCVKTNQGRYSRIRINAPVGPSPGTLKISYTTWEK